MIFLKRFEAVGFKSFADLVRVEFKGGMTGIVGPNGSGKSNFVDALKWVLGEQSNKQLRAKHGDDFIFSGAYNKSPGQFAQVSLTFDNSQRHLNSPLSEITITRRMNRGLSKNEYFINHEPALLKQIQDFFLDTGLSKGSLCIISQGTISWFCEARATDRRKIFDVASGIGRYHHKKAEASEEIRKTTEYLEQVMVLLKEKEKELHKLHKQVEKAKVYLEKKQALSQLEITMLVKDIIFFENKVIAAQAKFDQATKTLAEQSQKETEIVSRLQELKHNHAQTDEQLQDLQAQVLLTTNEHHKLLTKKTLFEANLQNDLNAADRQKRVTSYEQLIVASINEANSTELFIAALNQEIITYQAIDATMSKNVRELDQQIYHVHQQLSETKSNLRMVEELISNKYRFDLGVKTILEHKTALTGIYDTVQSYLTVDEKYEKAIVNALGKASKNIIVQTSEDASAAIAFLKQNKAGKATFMPLRDLKPKPFKNDYLTILNELDGFIGLAAHLVQVHAKFQVVVDFLLNQILISDNLQHALLISRYVNQMYKVITLEGDVIFPGGVISGGFDKRSVGETMNLEKQKVMLETQLGEINTQIASLKVNYDKLNVNFEENKTRLNSKQNLVVIKQNFLTQTQQQIEKYKLEYEQLTNRSFDDQQAIDFEHIASSLTTIENKLDQQKMLLTTTASTKNHLQAKIAALEYDVFTVRQLLAEENKVLQEVQNTLIRGDNFLKNALQRLSEVYQLTKENALANYSTELPCSEEQARENIKQLQSEIAALGNINFDAINDLEALQADFDTTQTQFEELVVAQKNLQGVIHELDKKAKHSFLTTLDKVNSELAGIFRYLFGGGSCEVVCADLTDVLGSGIEIFAKPPGKKVTNLMLFSGGEKTLVALAVLFAVLKVSTLPMIILDEAESALDPGNVDRFAKMIKKYAETTQFIVITHRPITMEACQQILGVTMQTPGVSKLLRVDLEQKDQGTLNT